MPQPETGGQSTLDTMRGALEAERARIADEYMRMAEERLKLVDAQSEAEKRTRPKWWLEWMKPTPVLAIAGVLWAAGQLYTGTQGQTAKILDTVTNRLDALSSRMDREEQSTRERVRDFVPVIQKSDTAIEQMKLINTAQDDRLNNVARSMDTLRISVEKLRDTVETTHEELMIEKTRREGRLMIPHGPRAPTPDDNRAEAR